jgi:hypothetical protein
MEEELNMALIRSKNGVGKETINYKTKLLPSLFTPLPTAAH